MNIWSAASRIRGATTSTLSQLEACILIYYDFKFEPI